MITMIVSPMITIHLAIFFLFSFSERLNYTMYSNNFYLGSKVYHQFRWTFATLVEKRKVLGSLVFMQKGLHWLWSGLLWPLHNYGFKGNLGFVML